MRNKVCVNNPSYFSKWYMYTCAQEKCMTELDLKVLSSGANNRGVIKLLLRANEGFPMFFDRPCTVVYHSRISISSTVPLALPKHSFCPGHCHYAIIATVLVPQRNWALGVCVGYWEEWLPSCQESRILAPQEGAGFILGIVAETCRGEVFVIRLLERSVWIRLLKIILRSTFLVDLNCSYLSGLYSMPCLPELFFFKYKPY